MTASSFAARHSPSEPTQLALLEKDTLQRWTGCCRIWGTIGDCIVRLTGTISDCTVSLTGTINDCIVSLTGTTGVPYILTARLVIALSASLARLVIALSASLAQLACAVTDRRERPQSDFAGREMKFEELTTLSRVARAISLVLVGPNHRPPVTAAGASKGRLCC